MHCTNFLVYIFYKYMVGYKFGSEVFIWIRHNNSNPDSYVKPFFFISGCF